MSKTGPKINTTKDTNAGDVLGSTLSAMEEYDMNNINDKAGSHDYNTPTGKK